MVEIKLANKNDYLTGVTLDKVKYYIGMSWNSSGKYWSMSLLDELKNTIIRGVVVIPNFPLLKQYRRAVGNLPGGELVAVVVNETSPDAQEIGRDGFSGGRFSLVYIPEMEYREIAEG